MSRQSAVFILAGSLVLLGVALGTWVSHWWYLLDVFVGLNLAQSGFTGFCPGEAIFARLGLRDARCPASAAERSRG